MIAIRTNGKKEDVDDEAGQREPAEVRDQFLLVLAFTRYAFFCLWHECRTHDCSSALQKKKALLEIPFSSAGTYCFRANDVLLEVEEHPQCQNGNAHEASRENEQDLAAQAVHNDHRHAGSQDLGKGNNEGSKT